MDTTIPIRYQIRRPGCCSWAENLTRDEAVLEVRRANKVAPGHHILAEYRDGSAKWCDRRGEPLPEDQQ